MTSRILLTLDYGIYARGFGDGFHEGIESLMIRQVNPRLSTARFVRQLYVILEVFCHKIL